MSGTPSASERPTGAHLRRTHRLRTSREFQRVSREGQRAASRSFVVLVAPPEGASETQFERLGRLGLTVSRRVGGAVVRNRVKRRVREWFRTTALRAAGGLDVVVIARPPAVALSGAPLAAELDALARQAAARVAR